jgi:hypothetical protein
VVDSLDEMLKRAAGADEWTRVVHRCAWCQRVENERGEYVTLIALSASTVVTDGMCPPCGARAMAQLATRQVRRQPVAA